MPQKITKIGGQFWKFRWRFNNNVYSYKRGNHLGWLFVVLVAIPFVIAVVLEIVK